MHPHDLGDFYYAEPTQFHPLECLASKVSSTAPALTRFYFIERSSFVGRRRNFIGQLAARARILSAIA